MSLAALIDAVRTRSLACIRSRSIAIWSRYSLSVSRFICAKSCLASAAQLLCGTKITAQTIAQNGWEAQISSDDEYIVTESNNQTISFNGKNVNDFFRQMESFKPILKVLNGGSAALIV